MKACVNFLKLSVFLLLLVSKVDAVIAAPDPPPVVYTLVQERLSPSEYPADPTTDIPWESRTLGVTDIEEAFNNSRTTENTQLGSSIVTMTLPSQTEWDALSDGEKALWLINRERVDRGVAALEGLEANVTSVAQGYAQYLLDNDAFAHDADGNTSWERLNVNSTISACHDSLSVAENLAVFAGTSAASVPLPLERAIYDWMYDDSGSTWEHRHAILWYPYNDNGGVTGQEGFLGMGRANGGPYQGTLSQVYDYAELIVMNVFDPCATWNYGAAAPIAPSALSVSLSSQTAITLTWMDNSDNEDGFKIERSSDGSSGWAEVGSVVTDVTTYGDTGLVCETAYYYRVYAHNATGNSTYSSVVSGTTTLCPSMDSYTYHPAFYKNYYGYNGTLYLHNPNPYAANVVLDFFEGGVSVFQVPYSISAYGLLVVPAETVTGLTDGTYGLVVSSDQPVQSVLRLYSTTGDAVAMSLYRGLLSASSAQSFVPLYKTYGVTNLNFSSSFLIWNVSDATANVQVNVFDALGLLTWSDTSPLVPWATQTWMANSIVDLPDSFHGWVTVSADRPVLGQLMHVYDSPNVGQEYVEPLGMGSTLSYLPRVMKNVDEVGGVRSTWIVVMNPETTQGQATLRYYDNAGGIAYERSLSIPASTSMIINVEDELALSDGTYAAVLTSDVFLIVSEQSDYEAVSAYALGEYGTEAATTLSLPALLRGSSGYSVFSVQNVDASAATVNIEYYDVNGSVVYSESPLVASLGWVRSNLDEVTALGDDFVGSAIISSSGPVKAWVDEYTWLAAAQPISGVVAMNDSPTELGNLTTFTATLAQGDAPSYTWAFGDGTVGSGAVVHHTYSEAGYYVAQVVVSNTVNAITATTQATVTVNVTAEPETEATLVYTDTGSSRLTTVVIPSGAVTETTTVALAEVDPETLVTPSGLGFAGHAFDLGVGQDAGADVVFQKPVTLTLAYAEDDVQALDESSLLLYRWTWTNETQWDWLPIGARAGETQTLDIDHNIMTATLLSFSRFGTYAAPFSSQFPVFLPLILRK